MTPVTQALSSALLHFVWEGIAGGLLLAIALLLLRKQSPNSRYIASCAVLALLGLAPVVTGLISYQALSGGADSAFSIFPGSTSSFAVYAISDKEATASLRDFEVWVLPLWTVGVLVFALRLAWASGHASSLRRQGVNADAPTQSIVARLAERAGIRRTVRVLMSTLAEVPAVVGWLRPVILLPVAVVTGLTPQQLEALIAHELAHVRRYDYLVNILQMVVETFFFYHPAVWWVSSRIRYERELCCDDLAVRLCGDPVSYARALTQLEKMRPTAPTLAMGSADGPLFHRVQRLLGRARTENGPSRLACAVGLVVGVLCLGLFLKSARAQQETAVTPLTLPSEILIPLAPVTPVAPLELLAGPAIPPVIPQNPLPPVAPLPPSPPAIAPPLPPAPPPLPPLGLAFDEAHWVLFRGSDVVVHGNASDEAEARKARSSLSGDLLWFHLDGKSYVTQDKEILEGIQTPEPPGDAVLSAALERSKLALDNALSSQRTTRDLQELVRQFEERFNVRKVDQVPAEVQQNQIELQRQMEIMIARNARLQAGLQIGEVNLQVLEVAKHNFALAQRRTQDFLRDSVRTGRAQTVP